MENWDDLSKDDKMKFNLKLGEAIMEAYKEAVRLHKINKKPCTERHDQYDWECDWMIDGTEVHLMKADWMK